ncbi:transmembrane emp24 domain-containing protein 9-like [Oryx dammah]|uniref:transmembrane emp24 domain-containing protein 9-like n=1 Tax=Oryx dammah TaxID=59534 RepID=UPI001A9C04DE|nr:transmembrane emp24 domain-containing protein 9-like [Oryx dammah]
MIGAYQIGYNWDLPVRSLRRRDAETSDSPGKAAGACGTRGPGPRAGPGLGWGRARAAGLALPLLLWQLLPLAGGGGAFYLEVRELEEKCFIQEIPDGTVVIGNYKTELYNPAMEKYQPSPQWISLFVFVKDPENEVKQALTPCSPAPFTHFRTRTDAFSLTSSFLVWPVRVRTWDTPGPRGSFTFTSQSPGEHEVCLHLKSIRFALFYDGKLRQEEHFRQTSKSTNQRVLWWSILQTLILVATGIWQMQRLKSFFKAKNLV